MAAATAFGGLGARMAAGTIEKNVVGMARRFVVGETPTEALPVLRQLREDDITFTVDLLGEVTVSEVEVTQDLKEGKVWTSVLGGDAAPVIDKLNREHGSIQSKVMKRVVLKSTPVLRFHHDASAVRGVGLVNLLDEVEKLPKAPEAEAED